MTCQHWATDHYCGAEGTRLYLPGPRCAAHTPAAVAGRPAVRIDPAKTLEALRAAHGLRYNYRATDTALNDRRAVASGRRRSTPAEYRLARS